VPYGTYLERLRALPVGKYLAREQGQPYPHGVAEAVLLSLEAVRADDPGGRVHRGDGVHGGAVDGRVRRDLLYDAGQAGVLGGPGTVVTAVAVATGRRQSAHQPCPDT
jgi:hypothetical protein